MTAVDGPPAERKRSPSRVGRWFFADGPAWVCGRTQGKVLEVAVGDGRNLEYYPEGIELVGIDVDPQALEQARERAATLGRKVTLRHADPHVLPYPADSFDCVVCIRQLCRVADHEIVLGEMVRVTRPGGSILLLDHVASKWRVVRGVQRVVDTVANVATGEHHHVRRHLPYLVGLDFEVVAAQRLRAAVVERVEVRKPASAPKGLGGKLSKSLGDDFGDFGDF